MPTRPRLTELFSPFCTRLEWMSLESAEMTKHALNAFLATSVTFINEVARLCEEVGADAKEVERGLKSEGRIGPRAYLSPGAAFAGGTLARDLRFLVRRGRDVQVRTPLLQGVLDSNEVHKDWVRERVEQLLAGIAEPVVAVLGLTYKPGTSTLRAFVRRRTVLLAARARRARPRLRSRHPCTACGIEPRPRVNRRAARCAQRLSFGRCLHRMAEFPKFAAGGCQRAYAATAHPRPQSLSRGCIRRRSAHPLFRHGQTRRLIEEKETLWPFAAVRPSSPEPIRG